MTDVAWLTEPPSWFFSVTPNWVGATDESKHKPSLASVIWSYLNRVRALEGGNVDIKVKVGNDGSDFGQNQLVSGLWA
jgi:hypothetical protein